MATTYKPVYAAGSTAYTISPANVATSSTFTAGVQSDAVSNISNLDLDYLISGLWTTGTTPTTNTAVQAWAVPPLSDDLASTVTWPDTITGAGAAAKTITSAGVLSTLGALVGVGNVDSATSNRGYYSRPQSLLMAMGTLTISPRHVLFVAHNSGVNSNTTAGNHAWYYLRVQLQGV